MKRLLCWLVCAALALGLAGCAASDSGAGPVPDYVLTYAENQPEGHPATRGALWFAERVRERTGGKVVIQVKYGGVYGTEQEVLAQMDFGGIDLARVSLAALSDELPELNVLQLPFLYPDADSMWAVLDGKAGSHFLQLFEQAGLVGLSWYDAGARSFYSDRWILRSPEDLQGLTVRVQDSQLMLDMIELLGAEPVTFAYSDVYYAFETGQIDVAENNWTAYQMLRHYEVAKYYIVDEHARVPEVQLASGKTWQALPEEYREILRACAQESALYEREIWSVQEAESRREAIESGCREIRLSEEAYAQFRAAVQPLYETYGDPALLALVQKAAGTEEAEE